MQRLAFLRDGLTGMQTGQIQPLILQKFPLPLVLMIHSLTSHGTAKKVTAMPLLLYILELIMSKKVVRYLIYILLVCVFAIFVFKLNQTEKTELVVRTGQTFEKAEVTEILQDNLDSNGTRVGEQKVRVKMLTGARKGEELDITSSSGYLFGAACKVGMKVIVMQSVAGETTIASVLYKKLSTSTIYIHKYWR